MRSDMKRKPRRPLAIERIESLESRALMSGTVHAAYAGPHDLYLTLTNGQLSATPGQALTINAQQYADGGNGAVFSGRIVGPPGTNFDDPTAHTGNAIVRFRPGAAGALVEQTTFSAQEDSPEDATRKQVSFSGRFVPLAANATTSLRVAAVRPTTGQSAQVFGDLRILVDTIRPTVDAVGPIESPRDTPVTSVAVAASEALQLGQFTFADLTLTRDGAAVPLDATVTVAAAAVPNQYTIGGLGPFTNAAGTYELTVNAAGIFDAVGNPASGSRSASFVFDPELNVPPAPPSPTLQAASDTGASQDDGITSARTLTFDAGGVAAGTTLRLLRDGVFVADRVGPGPISVASVPGVQVFTAQLVGPTGLLGHQSDGLSVVVDVTPPPVSSVAIDAALATFSGDLGPSSATTARRPRLVVTAPDDPSVPGDLRFAEIYSIDGAAPASPTAAPPTSSGQAIAPLTVPADLAPGRHKVEVLVRDAAGNPTLASLTFTVLANPSLAAPGTPAYSSLYDLGGIEHALNPDEPASEGHGDENPWSMSFDRTTQTVWAVVRGDDKASTDGDGKVTFAGTAGNRLVQLDPATGRLRAWTLDNIDPHSGPHGVFFDFETHLTPRVWFTQRTGETEPGRLSYLDLSSGEVVTYDLGMMLRARGYTTTQTVSSIVDGKQVFTVSRIPAVGDVHAVFSDRRGVVWVSDERDGLILELDLRDGGSGLASDRGTLVVHKFPEQPPGAGSPVLGTDAQEDAGGPHGLDVVVDDRDGQPLVYFTAVIQGRFNMLKPGAAGQQDLWVSWDIDALVRQEQGLARDAPAVGQPLFPTIDTNETPGFPDDDRIYLGDPGFRRGTALPPGGVIRELAPGNPARDLAATSSPIRTWQVPPIPGAGRSLINQTFVDRDGTVFFIDRQGSVGRLDAAGTPGETFAALAPSATYDAPIVRETSAASGAFPLAPVPRVPVRVSEAVLAPVDLGAMATTGDFSGVAGLDRHRTITSNAGDPGRGNGPFRGALSAGSIVYSSLTQGDQIASTLFAEEARREVAIVAFPDGARKAFQTLRDGRVVLTDRAAGSIVDRQSVLTRAGVDPLITGDIAAVADAAGGVHAFGRDDSGGLAEYRLDPATKTWTSRLLGRAATDLAGDPQAYLDPIRGAAALATTTDGHLVAFYADGGPVVDLTLAAFAGGGPSAVAAGRVYSKPGVVVVGRLIFAYGTNQKGDLLEYVIPAGAVSASAQNVLPATADRGLRLFQDIEAVATPDGTRHVFGSDGTSRLVHVTITPVGVARAENVTELTKDLATGYAPYQQAYAARVYGGANPVLAADGEIAVYGTNGRDLVEFRLPKGGTWSAANLTNRPANRVFGNPSAYVAPNGDRHVLLINEDGEMVEYYKLHGLDFATFNITLSLGNSGSPPSFSIAPTGTLVASGADDHANAPGVAATPLDLATGAATVSGRIGASGDRDVFRFVASRTGKLVVTLKSAGGRGLDPVLAALSAGGRRLARNDDASPSSVDSRVTFRVVAGRTYYLAASGKARQIGAYTLSARYADAEALARRARAIATPVAPAGPSKFRRAVVRHQRRQIPESHTP